MHARGLLVDRAVWPEGRLWVGGLGALEENEGKRTYYRVYCADCSADDVVDKLRDMFDKVFHQMAMRVVVEHIEEGSHVAETVAALREFPSLHFTK